MGCSGRAWAWAVSGGLAVMLASGCDGCTFFERAVPKPEGGPDGAANELTCGPAPSTVRRLTHREFANSVRDLVGDTAAVTQGFPPEEEALGFTNNADAQQVSQVLVEKYLVSSEGIARRATRVMSGLLRCDPVTTGEEACARQFIETFGRRTFRRPLSADDAAELFAVYATGRARGDFREGIEDVIQVTLQAPEFLYRIEEGVEVEGNAEIRQISDYEMASRLSYLMWGTLPDEELLNAAQAGKLSRPEEIEAQARRMLDDPRSRDTVRDFHAQWLRLGLIDEVAKDTASFPDWNPDIRSHLRAEADAFIEDVVWAQRGDLSMLFTSSFTFVDDDLARYYDLPLPESTQLTRVTLPPGTAAGFLTQGGLMAVLAKPNQTSPTHRGKFIREAIMCQVIPPPPDNVITDVPDPDPNVSARQRFAQHTKDSSCAGCHMLMDPIGFSFEKYDGIGRFRANENGRSIDDTGEVVGSDIGAYQGIPALAQKLANNPEVQRCVTRAWFRYGLGRSETEAEACTIDQLQERFDKSGRRPIDLLIALTQTTAFRFKTVSPRGENP
jgi:hypothetical protein